MNVLQALILGVIQGMTEFIPVSSSGHLVLLPAIFGWEQQSTAFDVVVHGGTLLALVIYFRKELLSYITRFSEHKRLILTIILATIPAAIIGIFLQDIIDATFKDIKIVVVMLISIGFIMLFIDKWTKNNSKEMQQVSIKDSVMIGLFQVLAYIRGTSRSGITTIGGLFAGLKLKHAAKYAFLIGIPIMTAAFAKQILDFTQEGTGDLEIINLVVGFFSSFVSGLFAIKFMLKFFEKRGLSVFGVYRILLGIVVLLLVIL